MSYIGKSRHWVIFGQLFNSRSLEWSKINPLLLLQVNGWVGTQRLYFHYQDVELINV
jgi:hypothetical protein